MGRTSRRRSRASIQEGVEQLDYELYQKLLEEFMASRPNSSVMKRYDQELHRQSEMSLSQARMSQRQQNKEDWIAYYEQRLAHVKALEPDDSPPRRGAIVTHAQLDMGDFRASLEDFPEDSENGHES